ncbi:MAG: ABC transporter ATP-binding protein [Verrucomicrobia bacterium]|nr:ABC transporter ATP-binding protein [Verrucomicrobiota bacterium]
MSREATVSVSPMLEMRGISKRYGRVQANDAVDLEVSEGQVLGLLGENGSGKSTLMKVLFGMVKPDRGTIRFKGELLARHSPREAISTGIGMIHQHFMLVEAMTVLENIMLGWSRAGAWLRREQIGELIRQTSLSYGLELDPAALVGELPFGQRQRVEIIKALVRGAELLILDEPTSNLSPPEISSLLTVMRRIADQGRAIIFITHKLGEVFDVCDEVVVLRDGRVVGKSLIANATRSGLAHLMVGRDVSTELNRVDRRPGAEVLVMRGVGMRDSSGRERLHDIDLSLREGEIVALAGVDGNGQTDLVDVLAGLKYPTRGTITVSGRDLTRATITDRLANGVAYIPVDRATTSLVPGMTIEENLGLRDFDQPPFRRGFWLNHRAFRKQAEARISEFRIAASGPDAPVQTLSGGNQQKVVIAREIGRNPKVLIAFQATWGLDPGATRFVVDQIMALRSHGGAVLYISSELDEVLMLGDRIGVIADGCLLGLAPRNQVDITKIGLMMAGHRELSGLT